jgi:hypothetical protein
MDLWTLRTIVSGAVARKLRSVTGDRKPPPRWTVTSTNFGAGGLAAAWVGFGAVLVDPGAVLVGCRGEGRDLAGRAATAAKEWALGGRLVLPLLRTLLLEWLGLTVVHCSSVW